MRLRTGEIEKVEELTAFLAKHRLEMRAKTTAGVCRVELHRADQATPIVIGEGSNWKAACQNVFTAFEELTAHASLP